MRLSFGPMRRGVLIVAAVCLAAVSGGCASQHQVTLQEYSGTPIVSTDGRTLTVGPYGLECGGTVTAVAHESRAKVALFLQYVSGGPACGPGEGAMAEVAEQRIGLRAPLGRRELVDGETGKATPWLSAAHILRPRLIPAGYRSAGVLPRMSTTLFMGRVRSAACMQIYYTQNLAKEFDIIQSPAGLQPPRRSDWEPIPIRGHPGRAAAGMITWREQGLTDLISASGGLTTSQLIAIANSAAA